MVERIIGRMIEYFGADVRRINHALKVYAFARSIGAAEGLDDKEMRILDIAAVLHDIGIRESERKYGSSAGSYQEKEGPPIARELLENFAIDAEILERACFLIGNHHSYGNINGKDFQALIEADFLVNIYEDGMTTDSIKIIRDKYFKTEAGMKYINSMYIYSE